MPKHHHPTSDQIEYAKTIAADPKKPSQHKLAAKLRIKGMAVKHIAERIGRPVSTVHYWLSPAVQEYQKKKQRRTYQDTMRRSGREERKRQLVLRTQTAMRERAKGLTYAEIAKRHGWSIRYTIRLANPATRRQDNLRAKRDMAQKRKIDPDFKERQRKANIRNYRNKRTAAGKLTARARKLIYEQSITDLIRKAHNGIISLVGKWRNSKRGRVGTFKCERCGVSSGSSVLLAQILDGTGISCACEKTGSDKLRNVLLCNQLNLDDPCQLYVYRTTEKEFVKPGISFDHKVRASHRLSRHLYAEYLRHWSFDQRRHAILVEQALLRTFRHFRTCPKHLRDAPGGKEVLKVDSSKVIRLISKLKSSLDRSTDWAAWTTDSIPHLTAFEKDQLAKRRRGVY